MSKPADKSKLPQYAAQYRAYNKRTVESRKRYYKKNKTKIQNQRKRYASANPDAVRETRRRAMLRHYYGITLEQYNAMLTAQGGVCAICKQPPKTKRLHVDHDHKDRRVRGLLCFRCNKLMVGKHTAETARRVLEYLEKDFDGRKIET